MLTFRAFWVVEMEVVVSGQGDGLRNRRRRRPSYMRTFEFPRSITPFPVFPAALAQSNHRVRFYLIISLIWVYGENS